MDADIKQQFDELKEVMAKQFAQISSDIGDFFAFVRDTVATKEDLEGVEKKLDAKINTLDAKLSALDTKVELGFSDLRSELRSIDERLTRLEFRVLSLSKGSTEDVDVLAKEYVSLRRDLNNMEDALRKYGIPIPKVTEMYSV